MILTKNTLYSDFYYNLISGKLLLKLFFKEENSLVCIYRLIFFKETKNYSIKKIVELKKGIELYSMNPTIREIHVDNINDLIIIGRIVKSDNESYFE